MLRPTMQVKSLLCFFTPRKARVQGVSVTWKEKSVVPEPLYLIIV
jgi:hypothetical protein